MDEFLISCSEPQSVDISRWAPASGDGYAIHRRCSRIRCRRKNSSAPSPSRLLHCSNCHWCCKYDGRGLPSRRRGRGKGGPLDCITDSGLHHRCGILPKSTQGRSTDDHCAVCCTPVYLMVRLGCCRRRQLDKSEGYFLCSCPAHLDLINCIWLVTGISSTGVNGHAYRKVRVEALCQSV